MASLDRQALLEQKRRRLQELKERRVGIASVDATQPNLAITTEPPVLRTKVDFAVQVDLIQPVKNHETSMELESCGTEKVEKRNETLKSPAPVKFDKIVQTHFEKLYAPNPASNQDDLVEAGNTEFPKVPENSEKFENSENSANSANFENSENEHAEPDSTELTQTKIESSLTEFLHDAGFRFSDLRLGIKPDQTGPDSDIVAPFHVTQNIAGFIDRPIVAVAGSPDHADIFIVAYGKPDFNTRSSKDKNKSRPKSKHVSTSSAGLAVIFNRSSGSIIPEFFLQCTSCIHTIMFDRSTSFKVFAGLENGRIVMWDLANVSPTQIAVLPTLQTSTVASAATKAQHNFIHHIAPIILMTQLNTESSQSSGILSICANGVVNLWSPNFLAFPKIASLRLPAEEIKIPFKITDAFISSAILRVPEKTGHQNPPEYNFLNSTVVASQNGAIYKLVNDKEKTFIRSKLIEAPGIEEPRARGVNSVVELKYNATTSFLLSAHADWSLKLWDMENCSLRFVSPTATLVTTIVVRPGHSGQFITIGDTRPPNFGLYVEFWDIRAKLLSPISIIPTREKKSGTALFSADGSEMVLAYDDGEIDIFSIEETLLSSQISSQSYKSVDEGVEKLLSSL